MRIALNVRREAIMVALAAAEVSWATAGFLALGSSVTHHQPLLLWLGLLTLLLGFSYIYRALDQANLSLRQRQILLLAVLLFSIILFFRFHLYADAELRGLEWFLAPLRQFADLSASFADDVIAVFTLIFFWARGILLARRSLSVEAVGFSFRSGVVILMWVALPAKIVTGADVSAFIPPYFFFALVAVALARVESVSEMPGSRRTGGSSFWIGSSMVAVAVVVLLGSLLAAFFSGSGMVRVLELLSPLLVVLDVVMVVVAYLFFGLVELILSLFSLDLSDLQELMREAFLELPIPKAPLEVVEETPLPEALGVIQAGVILLIIIVVIALILVFTWWRTYREQNREEDESRESLLSAEAIAQGLLDMLRSGRDRLGQMVGMVDRFGLGSRLLSAISIQRIYANLVRLATRAGYPRVKAQTPYEYLAVLNKVWPESAADVDLITEAYVSAHYGQVPDSREELQRIRESWERVRAREK